MKKMQVDKVSQSALLLFPLVKRLFNGDPGDPALTSLRNQTYHILRILERKGPLPVSAIGRQLFIAKQNMTTLIDRLMNDGLVERKDHAVDRRIVEITITKGGRKSLEALTLGLKEIVEANLARLSHEDVESLGLAFEIIRTIVRKLE